jgi:hypothetical protein
MVLGPSAAESRLPGSAPLLRLDAHPGAGVVTALLMLAVALGAVTVWLGLSGRWSPSPRRLLAVGLLATAAFAVSPPVGSADQLSYAAYGHIAATGHDPWTSTPAARASAGDPVAATVEVPWQDTPSVYGPLAAGEQDLAARIAGTDLAAIVELLDVVGALAVMAAGWLLWRLVGPEPGPRRRAMLLWTANPLVLIPLVAGAHVDALLAAFVLASAAAASSALRHGGRAPSLWWWGAAGALAGLATDIKVTGVLAIAGIAVCAGFRSSRRAAAIVLGSAALLAVPAYAAAGSALIDQLRRAGQLVSAATPWRPVVDVVQLVLPRGAARDVVGGLSFLVFLALVAALWRLLRPWAAGARRVPATVLMVVIAAYLLAAAYALPWYDATAWVVLAAAVAGPIDRVLVAHTAVLTLAYLPGRAAAPLAGVTKAVADGMRAAVGPIVLTVLTGLVAVLALRYDRTARGVAPGLAGQRRILPDPVTTSTDRQERRTQQRD